MNNSKKIILIRYGELWLKGKNKNFFTSKLVKNIRNAIESVGSNQIIKSRGRIYVIPKNSDYDFDKTIEKLRKVFGIASISPVIKIKSDFDDIKHNATMMAEDIVNRRQLSTFKVETKRADKKFPMKSPEISKLLGGHILSNIPSLSVDVHNPSFTIYVEIRENTYIFSESIPGAGGLPVGTTEKSVLLLSGGIDSPAAGWMMSKRGVEIEAVHFYSFPYTSERSKEKVIDLVRILVEYCNKIKLHIVPFTDIQMAIREKCPDDESTIVMRRFMMRIAERIAEKEGALSLITGESLGQVASQTMHALSVTNSVVKMPVFRPLVGMDKKEVIEIAKKIGTFETSILPYEDCCTVFVPKHPKTKPRLESIIESENMTEVEKLVDEAVNNTDVKIIE